MENCKDYSVTLQLDIMIFLKKKKKKLNSWSYTSVGNEPFFLSDFSHECISQYYQFMELEKLKHDALSVAKLKKISAFLTYSLIIMYFSSHEYDLFPFKLPFFSQLGSIVFAYRFMLLQMYFSVTWCESRRQLLGNEISIVHTSSYGNYRSMFVL